MVSETMSRVLERAVSQLARLRAYYGTIARHAASPTRELAHLLSDREEDTIAAIESWTSHSARAAQSWIRQAAPFPYHPATRELPEHPSVAELADVATQTDDELRALFDRFRTYAAADGANEEADALLTISDVRERLLGAAMLEIRQG